MLQFCKFPAGGAGPCKWQLKNFCFLLLKGISTFKELSQCPLVAKFNVIPPNPKFQNTCGFWAILCSHLGGEEYVFLFITGGSPVEYSQVMSRRDSLWGENSFVFWTQIVFISSQSSPGRPYEKGGKTQHMGPISPKRNALKAKMKTKQIFHYPPPTPPICIWKDYKPKEKVATTVPLTPMYPSLRFSDQFTTLVFSLSSPFSSLSPVHQFH